MVVPWGGIAGRFVGINISICDGHGSVVMHLFHARCVLVRRHLAIRRCCHLQRLE